MSKNIVINSEVVYIDPSYCCGTVDHHVLKRGKVLDIRDTEKGKVYDIDPWVSGYYGHKSFNIPEIDVEPSEERIEEFKKRGKWRFKISLGRGLTDF